MKRHAPYLTLFFLAAACGVDARQGTETKQIATNLDAEGASEATFLYWVAEDKVFQGECTLAPVSILNCQKGVRSLPSTAFKAALDSGLASSISTLEQRIASLEVRIPQLATQLAELSIVIAQAEGDVTAKTDAKSKADADLAQAAANIQSLTAQITALDAEIAQNPANSDLKTLRTKRQSELAAENSRKATLTSAATAAASQLQAATSVVQARKLESANVAFEYGAKKSDLGSSKTSLAKAQEQRASFDETIARLANDSIVYDVKSGETLFQNLRPFVSRFKQIFDGGALFATALEYADLNLSIPATGTSGTVEFPMDLAISALVQDVAVQFDMTHGSPADLTVSLIGPAGNVINLRSGSSAALKEIYSVDTRAAEGFVARANASLASLNGKEAKGVWKLRISDNSSFSSLGVGKLQAVKLMLTLKGN